jgi:CheY-like chemotaxis protein
MQKLALLVDDSRVARITLKRLLVDHEYDIVEFGSAEEALAFLENAYPLPDIIFMDVMMEGMDGVAATAQIKANSNTSDIPVVMCSGSETEADLAYALSTGALTILAKPPVGDSLSQVLQQISVQPMISVISETAPNAVTIQENPQSTIDEQALVSRIRDEVLTDMSQQYSSSMADFAQQLEQVLSAEQVDEVVTKTLSNSLGEICVSVKHSILDAVLEQTHSVTQNVIQKAVDEKLAAQSKLSVQAALAKIDLEHQAKQYLVVEGANWIASQHASVSASVQEDVSAKIDQLVEQALTRELGLKLPELVSLQVETLLNEQKELDDSEQKIEQLSAQLSQLKKTVVTLGLVLGSAVVALGVLSL